MRDVQRLIYLCANNYLYCFLHCRRASNWSMEMFVQRTFWWQERASRKEAHRTSSWVTQEFPWVSLRGKVGTSYILSVCTDLSLLEKRKLKPDLFSFLYVWCVVSVPIRSGSQLYGWIVFSLSSNLQQFQETQAFNQANIFVIAICLFFYYRSSWPCPMDCPWVYWRWYIHQD